VVVRVNLDRVLPLEPAPQMMNFDTGSSYSPCSTAMADQLGVLPRQVQRMRRPTLDALKAEIGGLALSPREQEA
jgi:hypothetical protein